MVSYQQCHHPIIEYAHKIFSGAGHTIKDAIDRYLRLHKEKSLDEKKGKNNKDKINEENQSNEGQEEGKVDSLHFKGSNNPIKGFGSADVVRSDPSSSSFVWAPSEWQRGKDQVMKHCMNRLITWHDDVDAYRLSKEGMDCVAKLENLAAQKRCWDKVCFQCYQALRGTKKALKPHFKFLSLETQDPQQEPKFDQFVMVENAAGRELTGSLKDVVMKFRKLCRLISICREQIDKINGLITETDNKYRGICEHIPALDRIVAKRDAENKLVDQSYARMVMLYKQGANVVGTGDALERIIDIYIDKHRRSSTQAQSAANSILEVLNVLKQVQLTMAEPEALEVFLVRKALVSLYYRYDDQYHRNMIACNIRELLNKMGTHDKSVPQNILTILCPESPEASELRFKL